MGNLFDPENVERVQCFAPFKDAFGPGGGESVVVDESDYDRLLGLYRDQALLLQRVGEACLIGCLHLPSVRLRD